MDNFFNLNLVSACKRQTRSAPGEREIPAKDLDGEADPKPAFSALVVSPKDIQSPSRPARRSSWLWVLSYLNNSAASASLRSNTPSGVDVSFDFRGSNESLERHEVSLTSGLILVNVLLRPKT